MADITVTLIDDDEPLPPDAIVLPALEDMDVEEAVKLLRSHGLDEADARFEVALARGEVDGDLIPVREDEAKRMAPRRDRHTA
jgi:hypothetical protein